MSGHWPPVASLVPHRGRALLVEDVVALREDGIECRGRIPPDAALARNGRVPSFVGLEMAAQAAAVLEALRRRDDGTAPAGPRTGYLVSLRSVVMEQPEIPVGVPLAVSLKSVGQAGGLGLYEASLECQGLVCVRGVVGTFSPPAPASPSAGA
jgi:predicted hotdog family 3-hydroxylacyl-ACP dehydratase